MGKTEDNDYYVQPSVSFTIEGDELVRNDPVPGARLGICSRELIIDKATFLKCLEEWAYIKVTENNGNKDASV